MTPLNALVKSTAVRLVETSRKRPWSMLLLCLAVVGALGFVAATRLGMDSDLDHLLSAHEPWRQQQLAFDQAFPQYSDVVAVVVEAAGADAAEDATVALAARLTKRTDLFSSVVRPDADPYFLHEGLLFLEPDELSALTAQIIQAQAFIGSLAADPSLRGLFGTLNLALEGVARGEAKFSQLDKPLATIADTIDTVLAGKAQPLGWSDLLTGRKPRPEELRRFILLKTRNADVSGTVAVAAIHDAAREVGITADKGIRVRVTGELALESDELATLASDVGPNLKLSAALILLALFLALGALRLIVPILITLVAGLIATTGFAALAVGTLNPISVAFAMLFIGLAVDFSIQLAVHYREERYRDPDPAAALRTTAATMAGGVLLAALTTSLGFLAFLPTAYVGVSQLGLISGAGMLIAVTLNFTLLPALITLFRPRGETAPVGFAAAAPLDRWLARRRRLIVVAALVMAALGLALLPLLRFDLNPMDLRDTHTESVAVTLDLMADPGTSPFTADILVRDLAEAQELLKKLTALPEVYRALALPIFVPEGQPEKLAQLDDVTMLLGPTLSPVTVAPPPDAAAVRQTLTETVGRLRELPREPTAARLAIALSRVLAHDAAVLPALTSALLSGLGPRLDDLRVALSAQPVTVDTLPESLRHDWVAAGGRPRIQVFPAGNIGDSAVLTRFVAAVRAVAPNATGPAVDIVESARTIIHAFTEAGMIAFATIIVVLMLVLRRFGQVLLVLTPLALSGLMTMAFCIATGLQLNFANLIALPLMLGIGVAFNIYVVINWRRGNADLLQSGTARAVLFSALTTTVAFGTLALSHHPGTASMGLLLTISLAFTLINTLVTLPALLGPPPPPELALPQSAGDDVASPRTPS